MTDLAVSDLLATLSAELGRLADETEGFHDLIGDLRAADAALVVKAQAIDLTTQTLAGLAEFCANLASDTPPGLHLPSAQALSLVRLSDLRGRIVGGTRNAAERQPSEGALELF
jgi:hypothetical protein